MWQRLPSGSKRDLLEADAVCARLALACSYSSSAEYEAELIAERREAGVYGPRRHQWHVVSGVAAVATALMLLMLVGF